ncbi:MAG TPA: glycosyltransferase family 4 protein [Thermoanaerobaculaceae bacterium]|nr:glycosyltransferase family 4 protein [Thermoanaerobaculaceae bacterium]
MRVTVVTGPFLPVPPAPCGAAERIWHGLAEAFATRGHHVTFLCRRHQGQGSDEVIKDVRFLRIRGPRRTRFLSANLLADLGYSLRVLRLLPPADVLVLNVFWLPTIATWRRTAGKVVVNVGRMPKGQMVLYRRASRLAAVSVAVAQRIAQQCPSVMPLVKVFANPVNADIFRPPPVPRSWKGTKVIIYAGRIHPEKGLRVLLEAFRELALHRRDVTLKLVGPHQVAAGGGGDRFLASLKDLARGLPVDFLGEITSSGGLASILQTGHIFVYPSVAENGESFGLAVLEAMATGLVPVVSALDCFKEFVTAGQTGLAFDHHDPGAGSRLACTFSTLLGNTEWAASLGSQAVQATKGFSVDEIAERYLADFEELLTQSNPPMTLSIGVPP